MCYNGNKGDIKLVEIGFDLTLKVEVRSTMKVSASFARAEDGMVVATLYIQRTDNDPLKLLINMDGEKVLFTTETKEHTLSKTFNPTDVGGAEKWARKLTDNIRKQVEVYRIKLPEDFEAEF